MSGSLGDFDANAVIHFKFTTYRPSTGAPFTLDSSPILSVYKDASTTQSTAGVTLTADFDGVTGMSHVAVDTSADGTFYAEGSFFDVVITTGTVDSVSAVGTVVGRFTLRKTAALKPTTARRTLDVSAGGEAGIDWANVGSPTTTLNLSGTTIKTSTDIATDTAAIKAKTDNLPASPAATGAAMTLTAGAVDAIHDEVVEGSTSMREMLRGFAAVLMGKAAGLATTTATYRDIGDTKARITATVDADGNRTSVTRDLS